MGFYIFERLVAVKPRTKTNFGYGASCRKKGKRSNSALWQENGSEGLPGAKNG